MNYSSNFLVVDDMEGMRRILTNSLRQLGMGNIVTAVNGADAWRLMQTLPFDVVISDWNMPVMSGLELLQKIRTSKAFANLPVLMMTAETERHQVQVAIEAGVSDYLIKPFSISALETKLKKVIAQPRPKAAPAARHIPAILKGARPALPPCAKAETPPSAAQPTLLVVDDVPDNLDVLVALLSDAYQVRATNSGERALKIIESGKIPDLILLDVMMPGMDGFEVCRRLKANAASADIPVIFLTAMSESTDIAKGFALGAVDFVTKPADPPILRARIATHLALRRQVVDLERYQLALLEQNTILQDNLRLRDEVDRMSQHDLKNPIAGIIGFSANLLADPQLPQNHKEVLQYIEQAAYNVLNMVNLSLDLYNIEQGRYQFTPGTVALGPLLNQIVREMGSELLTRQIRIQWTTDGQAMPEAPNWPVQGDELLCYSMFGNLLKNAMEAARDDTEINIDLLATNSQQASDHSNKVTIRISNDGVVPLDIRAAFFDKFSTSGKPNGTGLGTYSARLIALTQQGDIAMETSDEQGRTTLTVTLPYAPHAELTNPTP